MKQMGAAIGFAMGVVLGLGCLGLGRWLHPYAASNGDYFIGADGTLTVGAEQGGKVAIRPGGSVPPLEVLRTVIGGPPHGQAVAVFTNTVPNQDISIKVVSTKEFSSSNLWFANTFHNVSGSLSMGVNPGTPAEMSIVFNEDSSTIPSSIPPPRYTVSAGAVRTYQRAKGFGIGKEPQSTLDVYGDAYISDINSGVILRSPNGNCWKVTVNDTGQLITTSVPPP